MNGDRERGDIVEGGNVERHFSRSTSAMKNDDTDV